MEPDRYHLAVDAATSKPGPGIHWEFLFRKALRTLQVNFPFAQDLRFSIQRAHRALTDTVCEPDFDALRLIPWLDNGIAIDIGANRGDTVQAIRMRTHNMKVMAFEPNPLVYSKLHRMYKHIPDVKLFNFGLGDKDDIMALHIPFYRNFMFDGLASFLPEAALGWLEGRMFFYDERHLSSRKIDCCITKLDCFGIDPVFIKIDVQGFESQVLKGGIETLQRSRPVVLIETPTREARVLMRSLNFNPYRFSNGVLKPGFGDLNTFYIAEEKARDLAG